jgi:hypothetical protein
MHAELDSLCQFGSIYEVMIGQRGYPPVKLIFDLSGNFLAVAERARYANAPQVIIDNIAANYADFRVRHVMELFTLADGSLQYSVFLGSMDIRKNIVFNDDGTIICETERIHG